MSLPELSGDEAALLYHVGRFGSDGYPVARLGRKWIWRDWRGVKGAPMLFATRRAAVNAFEGWCDLARMRWAEMKRVYPNAILTGEGWTIS